MTPILMDVGRYSNSPTGKDILVNMRSRVVILISIFEILVGQACSTSCGLVTC